MATSDSDVEDLFYVDALDAQQVEAGVMIGPPDAATQGERSPSTPGGDVPSQRSPPLQMLLNIFTRGQPEVEAATTGAAADAAAGTDGDADDAAAYGDDLAEELFERLEEVAREIRKDITVTLSKGLVSDVLTTVRARADDKVSVLSHAASSMLSEAGPLVSLRLLFEDRVLHPHLTLAEAGITNGSEVSVLRSPLRCLTASFDGSARLWELNRPAEAEGHDWAARCVAYGSEHGGAVLSADLSPDGEVLLTVAAGGEGRLWSTLTGEEICLLPGQVTSGTFSHDGARLVGASSNGTAKIWSGRTGQIIRQLELYDSDDRPRAADDVKTATFSPDDRLVAVAYCDGIAGLFDADGGHRVALLAGHHDVVRAVEFSRSGRLLLTGSMDCTARLWSVATGKCLHELRGHRKTLSCASISSDEGIAVTASFDGTVRLWWTCTGELMRELSDGDCDDAQSCVVNAAVLSPDNSSVLVASSSEVLRMYDVSTGYCIRTFCGHEEWVRSASFSPDGALVASASYDGHARIWNAWTGECLMELGEHKGAVILAEIVAT